MKDDDLIKTARRQMDDAATADRANRDLGQTDLLFAIGKHWPDDVAQEREEAGKPCMTFNRVPQALRRVTSQIRAMNPAVKVIPADGAASEDVAEIMAGMIRQIEYECDASSVYERAGELAAACGIGWFRIRTDYADPLSFDQECLIERINNPFAVFCDPKAVMPDRSDAKFIFIAEDMMVDDFKAAYRKARVVDSTSDHHIQGLSNWLHGERVTVAEYYWLDEREVTIGQLADGTIVESPKAPMVIIRTRKTKIPQVKWAKISGVEVLEGPLDVPTTMMPVISVTGEEWPVGETLYRSSVHRFAQDAQRLYNMARTSNAEVIAMQSKAPYMVSVKQVEGLEQIWGSANTRNSPYLPFNPDPINPGRPQREMPPVSSQAYLSEIQIAAEDIKATTGIHDASLGGQLAGMNLQPYMNPYTQGVINTTLNTMGQDFQQQQNNLDAQATAAGAFGGSRHGVAMGQAANSYQQNVANTVAGLNQSNFQQAQTAAQGDVDRRMQTQQFNIGTMLDARGQNAQMQLATRQANASNNLAGMNTQLQAGAQLGNLSNLGFGMGRQVNADLNAAGTQQQQLIQSLLNAGRQQYCGFTGAGTLGLAGVLSAIGGSPTPQSSTTTSNPGLLGILSGGASILGALCWVARSIYGTEDGKWLQFRKWMLLRSPDWLPMSSATARKCA